MVIKKREKEQTAFEQRNTSILTFALVALIPLLLSAFMGFGVANVEGANWDQYFENLEALRKENNRLKNQFEELSATFFAADTLLRNFTGKDLTRIKKELEAVKDDLGFEGWDRKKGRVINNFRTDIDNTVGPNNFSDNEELTATLSYAVDWLSGYADAIDEYLSIRRLAHKQIIDIQSVDDQDNQISMLQAQLQAKDFEILQLQHQQGGSRQEIQATESDKSAIEQDYAGVLENNEATKEKILAEITTIKDEILPNLKKGIFNSRFETLKSRLNNKLQSIDATVRELKVQE